MITWHQIDQESVVGRDAVISTPGGILRGPISSLKVTNYSVQFTFFWTAVRQGSRWKMAGKTLLGFNRKEPVTLPVVDQDGRIRFRFNIDGFGDSAVLPPGDNLDPFEVEGLDLEIDRSHGEF